MKKLPIIYKCLDQLNPHALVLGPCLNFYYLNPISLNLLCCNDALGVIAKGHTKSAGSEFGRAKISGRVYVNANRVKYWATQLSFP